MSEPITPPKCELPAEKKMSEHYKLDLAERITGYSSEEVLGHSCKDNILIHVDCNGKQLCLNGCPLLDTIQDGDSREAEVFLHHKNGHRLPVLVKSSPTRDAQGQIIGAVEIFSDNTKRQEDKQRIIDLEKLALLDKLTQLANRRYLEELIYTKLEELKRVGIPFGILFFDIDFFKKCNDTYGHDLGDEVLKMVGRTFELNSRPYDVIGRWGGEEFIAVISYVNANDLLRIANQYRVLIQSSSVAHNKEKISVTVSIGATMAKQGDTKEELIARSDSALYKSKNNGRNCVTNED